MSNRQISELELLESNLPKTAYELEADLAQNLATESNLT